MKWTLSSGILDFGSRAQVMGILNVTPDSFYDRYGSVNAAVERGLEMVKEGADILDVGGESSRPPMYGEAVEVSCEEECLRVLPVIEKLREQTAVPISIDTVKSEVARRALEVGADIINDISAMADDGMAEVAAKSEAPLILMHRRGTPATMQANTDYVDLIGEVCSFLEERIERARQAGVAQWGVDPGLGFSKTIEGNFLLLKHMQRFANLDCPLLVGASRKSFIWKTLGQTAEEALEGSLALAVLSRAAGAHILRVHDVQASCRALRVADAVLQAEVES
ncbi:MAG: dihydropteroate synthase [Candidatus Latescibacterota bacterium]